MIENRKDGERTEHAYKTGEFQDEDKRSYYSIAGHVYLFGIDMQMRRAAVMLAARNVCAICQERVSNFDGDLDHIKGGTTNARCDCFGILLANGKRCTNLRYVHSMFSKFDCHRRRHHRVSSRHARPPSTSTNGKGRSNGYVGSAGTVA